MTLTAEPAAIAPVTDQTSDPTRSVPAPIATVVELPADQIAQHPDNIRDATRGIRELAASIAAVGVLVPLIVVPVDAVPDHEFEAHVTHVAVDGNRRLLAARRAGLPVPCLVRPDLHTARDYALTMAVTGLVRSGLTVREEARAVQTMLELGIEASAIGRATGRTRKQVVTARKAARLSGDLADAAAAQDLTLTDLAALTEWQHDPAAVEVLADAMGRGRLAHALAQLDATRFERQLTARTVRELTAAGVRCIDQRPSWGGTPCELSFLRAADAPPGQSFTPDAHAGCPGHVAHVDVTVYLADDQVEEHIEVAVTYGCADPAAYGHPDRWAATTTNPPGNDSREDDTDADDERTPAERAAQAQRQREEEAARADAARRQERSDLIRRNKEADAARVVRVEFVRSCLTAKTRHQQMTGWALSRILRRDRAFAHWVGQYGPPPVLGEILGCDSGTAIDAAASAPASRHPVMLWVYLAAAHEAEFVRDAHRQVSTDRAAYLQHLADLGYPLSDVEQRVIDNTTAQPTDPTGNLPVPVPVPAAAAAIDDEAGDREAIPATTA